MHAAAAATVAAADEQGDAPAAEHEEQLRELLLPTEIQLNPTELQLPATEVQLPTSPPPVTGPQQEAQAEPWQRGEAQQQQQQQQNQTPWLLAVKLAAKSGQLDWFNPEDAGGTYTLRCVGRAEYWTPAGAWREAGCGVEGGELTSLHPRFGCPRRDLRLNCADPEPRLWNASGDERCAVQRHKAAPPGGRGRPALAAAVAASSTVGGAEAAAGAEAATWAAANTQLVAALRQRVAAVLAM